MTLFRKSLLSLLALLVFLPLSAETAKPKTLVVYFSQTGTTVIPFATYYLSGIDETLRHIESLTPDSAHKKGLGLTARTLTQTAVENWIGEIMNENATLCYSKRYKQ